MTANESMIAQQCMLAMVTVSSGNFSRLWHLLQLVLLLPYSLLLRSAQCSKDHMKQRTSDNWHKIPLHSTRQKGAKDSLFENLTYFDAYASMQKTAILEHTFVWHSGVEHWYHSSICTYSKYGTTGPYAHTQNQLALPGKSACEPTHIQPPCHYCYDFILKVDVASQSAALQKE